MEILRCQPEMFENCRVFYAEGRCYEDIHHKYWPEKEYTTKTEKEFRELEVNKQFICRALHNSIHAKNRVSTHPSRETMIATINDQDNS